MPDGRTTSNGMARATLILGGTVYDSATFAIPDGVTNYNIKTDLSTYKTEGNVFVNTLKHGAYITEIRTDNDITLRFNATTNDPYSLEAAESPKVIPSHMRVDNIFITNSSGATATVRIFLQ